jgi:hypothetical protein
MSYITMPPPICPHKYPINMPPTMPPIIQISIYEQILLYKTQKKFT